MEESFEYKKGYKQGHKDGFDDALGIFIVVIIVILMFGFLFVSKVRSQESLIKNVNEVFIPNRSDNGICWFCCAEMLGKYLNIGSLEGLTKRVINTGIGLKHGARQEDIDYWMKELKLTPLSISTKDTDWLCDRLHEGLPVITSHFVENNIDTHAVLMVGLGAKTKVKILLPDNREVIDYPVKYIDPNVPNKILTKDWDTYIRTWTGKALTFDPKNNIVKNKIPPLMPGRLMISDFQYHKLVPEEVTQRVQTKVNAAKQAMYLGPIPLPPFVKESPSPYEVIILPSNQDINDGVVRPDDLIRYGCYFFYTPEFLKTLKTKKE